MHIAISGKIASGKDQAAAILCHLLRHHYHRKTISRYPVIRRFAARMYQFAAELDGISTWTPYGWPAPTYTPTVENIKKTIEKFLNEAISVGAFTTSPTDEVVDRILTIAKEYPTKPGVKNRGRLQALDFLRAEYNPLFWETWVIREHEEKGNEEITILSDLRTIEEAEWCRQNGIFRIRLNVSPNVQAQRMSAMNMEPIKETLQHHTETQLDIYRYFSAVLQNDSDNIKDLEFSLNRLINLWLKREAIL